MTDENTIDVVLDREALSEFLKGNESAIDLNGFLYQIAEIWDDIIDNDKPKNGAVNQAFYNALVRIPRNQFYQANFALLSPVVESAILDWFAANELEATGDIENLRGSFVLRCGMHGFTAMCARIIGGLEWANAVNIKIRTMGGDTWAEYKNEHKVQ